MSTRSFWELSVKGKLPPQNGSSLEAIEHNPSKGAIKIFYHYLVVFFSTCCFSNSITFGLLLSGQAQ